MNGPGFLTYAQATNDPIEKAFRWKSSLDEARKNHMYSVLSRVREAAVYFERLGVKERAWDIHGFVYKVLAQQHTGGYCKGPTQFKTYVSFAMMTDGELTKIMYFLEKQLHVMKAPRPSLARACTTLQAEFEFRGLDATQVTQLTHRVIETNGRKYRAYHEQRSLVEESTYQEFYTSSPKSDEPKTIIDSVQRETSRLVGLLDGLSLFLDSSEEWELSEIDKELDEIGSDLSGFIHGHFDSSITLPYKIALSRTDEALAVQAIAYFTGLIRLILASSNPTNISKYRQEIDEYGSGESLSHRQQILHGAMIAILDKEVSGEIANLLRKPEKEQQMIPSHEEPNMIPPEETGVEHSLDAEKLAPNKKKKGRVRLSTIEKQRIFAQAIHMPFDNPEITLQGFLPSIAEIKRGFWSALFEAIAKLNPILKGNGVPEIPLTQTGLALFLIGKTTITKEEFLIIFQSFKK